MQRVSAIGFGSQAHRRCQEPSPTVTLCSLGTISHCLILIFLSELLNVHASNIQLEELL